MSDRHPSRPGTVPDNPCPAGGRFGWLQRPDGARLRYALWPADPANRDAGADRKTVVIVPGRTEFIEKYFETVSTVRARGWHVAILDLRGQGLSSRQIATPTLGHVETFTDYEQDLAAFMDEVVRRQCPGPYVILAHSMGAAAVLLYLRRHPPDIVAAVLTAPMLGLRSGRLQTLLARPLLRALKAVLGGAVPMPAGSRGDPMAARFERNIVTRDRARFERALAALADNPQLTVAAPTLGWTLAAFAAMAALADAQTLAAIDVPVLIAVAGADRIVDNDAIRRAAERLPRADVVTFPEARHEILMETDAVQDAFWRAFDRFLSQAL